jgi:GNAT superfamily N-acetyltransferase
MQIKQVENKQELKEFIELPYRLYKNDPVWVAPLRSEQWKLFTPEGDPLLKHCDYALYLLRDDQGKLIGRIMAFIDHIAIDFWKEKVGFFGSYECIDSDEAAKLLLDTARDFLKKHGMAEMRGPINLNVSEWGFIVEGFDHPPVILSPYNPPYYNRQVGNYGMVKAKDLLAWFADAAQGYVMPERFSRLFDRIAERYHVTLRPAEMKNLERDTWIMADIMNKSVAFNWGAYPVTREESIQLAHDLKDIVHPELILIAEVDGQPMGFAIVLPDVNQLLKGLDGRLFPAGVFRLLFGLKKIKHYRLWAMGLLPEYHGKGIDSMMYYRIYEVIAAKKGSGEINYVLEDNAKMVNPLEKMGIQQFRRYRVYTMPI